MYELMVVGTVDGAAALFGKVEKFLKEAEAQDVKSEKLGKKTLAYPIAKQQEAEFFVFNFEAPGEAILEIGNKIKLEQEAVLRYLLVKTKAPKKVSKVRKVPQVSKVSEVSQVPEVSKEKKVEQEVKPKVTVTATSNVAGVTAKAAASSKKTAKPVKSKKKLKIEN